MHECVLALPNDKCMCAWTVCPAHVPPKACMQASEERGEWAVVSSCWPWQSLHGTKAAQSSPSLLVSLAQPLLHLRRGGDVSLMPEPGTAGMAVPSGEELGMGT